MNLNSNRFETGFSMIALIQRVKEASVCVNSEIVGQIDQGLLVLLGVEEGDDLQKAERLCDKVLGYRIFSDQDNKMNLNVKQANGQLLVVSQFTLAADTKKGCALVLPKVQHQKKPMICIIILLNYARNKL